MSKPSPLSFHEIVFKDRAFKKVIKVRGQKGGVLIHKTSVLIRQSDTRSVPAQRKAQVRTQKEGSCLDAGRETPQDKSNMYTPYSRTSASGTVKNKFLLVKVPSL